MTHPMGAVVSDLDPMLATTGIPLGVEAWRRLRRAVIGGRMEDLRSRPSAPRPRRYSHGRCTDVASATRHREGWTVASRDPELYSRSVVLVGRFNPAIFHPQWFARMGLLPVEEADDATVEFSGTQVMQFRTNWFECLATVENLQLSTLQAEMEEPMRDLVVGVLDLLPHAPVWSFGLNFDSHYSIKSVDAWHELGHRLSPKELWSDLLGDPGTRAVVIQGQRSDSELRGALNVRVEPSVRVHPGIYINVNDHFDLRTDAPSTWEESLAAPPPDESTDVWTMGAEKAVAAIESEWSPSAERASAIVQRVLTLV